MQTIYYKTRRFIRHQGNLIDLSAYREKLDTAVGEEFFSEAAPMFPPPAPFPQGELLHLTTQQCRPRRRLRRLALALDFAASLAIFILTAAAVASFLRL